VVAPSSLEVSQEGLVASSWEVDLASWVAT